MIVYVLNFKLNNLYVLMKFDILVSGNECFLFILCNSKSDKQAQRSIVIDLNKENTVMSVIKCVY